MCSDCNSSALPSQVYAYQFTYNPNCASSTDCGTNIGDSKCIGYNGPALTCSSIATGDTLETVIQKLNTGICQTSGDYSTYNVHCLNSGGAITTESQFVDVISSFVCTTNTNLTTFTGTTFPAFQTANTAAIAATQLPAITCTSAGVTSADNLVAVLNKYCTKFGTIDTALDLTSVVWNSCFTVGSSPTTIAAGFNLLANQICQIKASGSAVTLPTFNNSGACLSTTGTADTLVATVNALRTRVCLSPILDINALTWGCTTKPSSTSTDLQGALQSVLTKIDGFTQAAPTYSSDFAVTNVDNANPCAGKHIALSTPLNVDRFVASNSIDTSPGTLVDKLLAGTNTTLDATTTPGKIIINSTATPGNGKVYADSTDGTLGFLDEKIEGSASDYITTSAVFNPTTNKVKITSTLDENGFILSMLNVINEDVDLKALFCSIVSSCPSPCQPPQNVQASYVGTTTSTTTTSTTAAPTTTSTSTTSTTTSTTTVPSDMRLKNNITLTGNMIGALKEYSWEWNNIAKDLNLDRYPTIGVIAQEAIEVYPQYVILDENIGYLRVNIEAIKNN